MTSLPVEGTFQIDGLFEGPLFAPEDIVYLETFVEQTRQNNIHFTLTRQFNRFSLLGQPDLQQVPNGADSIHTRLIQYLNGLLEQFSLEDRRQFTSTVRSVEFTSGQEIQTLYAIGSNGLIHMEQRTVNTQTRRAKASLSRRQILFHSLIAVLILGLSSLFVPYQKLASLIIQKAELYDVNSVNITAADFDSLFQIQSVDYEPKSVSLIISCEITGIFPRTKQALNQAWINTQQSLFDRLAIEAIARQQIRCLLYSESHTLITQWTAPITWSQDEDSQFMLAIPLHTHENHGIDLLIPLYPHLSIRKRVLL